MDSEGSVITPPTAPETVPAAVPEAPLVAPAQPESRRKMTEQEFRGLSFEQKRKEFLGTAVQDVKKAADEGKFASPEAKQAAEQALKYPTLAEGNNIAASSASLDALMSSLAEVAAARPEQAADIVEMRGELTRQIKVEFASGVEMSYDNWKQQLEANSDTTKPDQVQERARLERGKAGLRDSEEQRDYEITKVIEDAGKGLEEKQARGEMLSAQEQQLLASIQLSRLARGPAGLVVRAYAARQIEKAGVALHETVLDAISPTRLAACREAFDQAVRGFDIKLDQVQELQKLLEEGNMEAVLQHPVLKSKKAQSITSILFGQTIDKKNLDKLIQQMPEKQREMFAQMYGSVEGESLSMLAFMMLLTLGKDLFTASVQPAK